MLPVVDSGVVVTGRVYDNDVPLVMGQNFSHGGGRLRLRLLVLLLLHIS